MKRAWVILALFALSGCMTWDDYTPEQQAAFQEKMAKLSADLRQASRPKSSPEVVYAQPVQPVQPVFHAPSCTQCIPIPPGL